MRRHQQQHHHQERRCGLSSSKVMTAAGTDVYDPDYLLTLFLRSEPFTGLNEHYLFIGTFRSGLLCKALPEAKDLRHITIHTTTDIINGRSVYYPGH
jgi:hypothetical protein